MGNSIVANIFFMLGGIAVMMFGMRTMGANLERIAGNNMKSMLGKITNNRFVGVGIGATVTAIINSSAATTVMLVGFVNIGLITLTQAASVIMGANIGTTITAQILSLSGTQGVDIASIAALVAAAGMILALFFKNDKVNKIGFILVGLGFIFVGLRVMSVSVNNVIYDGDGVLRPTFSAIFEKDHFPLLLILIGIILTALIQSSAAVTGILIAIGGALNFQTAVFIILGSNIGTCVTAIISSIGTSTSAKRTAVIHLLFNLFGCLICIAPLWIWGKQFGEFMQMISGASVERQIANFHTLFNLLTTLVLIPFTSALVFLATKIIPDKERVKSKLTFTYIDDRLLETPPIAVGNTKLEIIRMAEIAKENINLCVDMLLTGDESNAEIIKENETVLNFLNKSITEYLTKLSGKNLSLLDERKVGSYYHVVIDLERVGDYAENITEYSAKLKEDNVSLSDEAKEELKNMKGMINELFENAVHVFDKRDFGRLNVVDEVEENIDRYSAELELKHVDRVKQGICSAQTGSVYLQTVSNLERVGDHITNVAFSIKQYRHK